MATSGPHGQPSHPMLDAIGEYVFGHTVDFDRPLTDHGRQLMNALGVNVVYTAPKRTSHPDRQPEHEG